MLLEQRLCFWMSMVVHFGNWKAILVKRIFYFKVCFVSKCFNLLCRDPVSESRCRVYTKVSRCFLSERSKTQSTTIMFHCTDMGTWDAVASDEKWFVYGAEQKQAIEQYLYSLRSSTSFLFFIFKKHFKLKLLCTVKPFVLSKLYLRVWMLFISHQKVFKESSSGVGRYFVI